MQPARSLRAKLASFPGGYWVAVMIALVQYGILGVMIAFMPEYLLRLYGRDKTDSPMLVAVIFAVALVTTTLHGFILTRFHTWWYAVFLCDELFFARANFFAVAQADAIRVGVGGGGRHVGGQCGAAGGRSGAFLYVCRAGRHGAGLRVHQVGRRCPAV